MRSLAEDSVHFESAADRKAHSLARHASPISWFSFAETQADRAASAGFVLSMVFLAVTAIYAFFLSDAAQPLISEASALADRAAFDAGFRLENLALSGFQNTPQAALRESLKLPYMGSSLLYDASDARARLLNLGWIESAEVRRILPSRLEVIVHERTPFARWLDAGQKVHVIDRAGHLLGQDDEGRFSRLPLFAGEGAPLQASNFDDAFQDREAIRDRFESAELIAERFWRVKLNSGLVLKLPRKVTPLVLEHLDSLLANPKIAGLGLETIDLRLSNRTILQLLEPTVANRDRAIAVLTSASPQVLPAPGRGKAL
ncbi:MAG: cell division protein FtsQ/DivIB [Rhodomicrobium sp.]